MTAEFDLSELSRRMQGAVAALKQELRGLRTGRASTALIEPVHVEAYGQNMPLNQLATISVPEPRMLSINVWEKAMIAHKYAEEARIAVRHVRRDGLDALKKMLKDKLLSEDDEKRHEHEIQKITDQFIGEIDAALSAKEAEIMHV